MAGTNYLTTVSTSPAVSSALTDQSGNYFLVTGSTPFAGSVTGYSIGCLMVDNVNGKLYINTGTATTATWTVVGSQS